MAILLGGKASFEVGGKRFILTTASQPELSARRLIVDETFTPSGNWRTYLPREANHKGILYGFEGRRPQLTLQDDQSIFNCFQTFPS